MKFEFSTEGLEDLITNPSAEVNGVRARIKGPVYFIMRRAGGANHEYDRVRSKLFRRNRRNIETMTNEEILERITKPAYLHAVIVGWEGVKDAAGKTVPFSRQACEAWLQAFPNAWDLVLAVGESMEAFSQERYEEAAASLGEDSAGR